MTAYTDLERISAQLGVALTTGAQAWAAANVADAVTAWIDDYLQQSWQQAAIVGEQHRAPCLAPGWADGGAVYLKTRPVVSVEAVRRRPLLVGQAAVTLATTDWELLDAAAGLLLVRAQYADLLLVDYTVAATPPAPVQLAATLLAGQFLAPLLQPGSAGLESLSVGQGELALRFAQHVQTAGLPPEVLSLLGGRAPVLA